MDVSVTVICCAKTAGFRALLELQVTASKPLYAVGAKASISLRLKQQQKQTSWTLAADNDDDELLDEDELLTEEDRQRPAVLGADWLYADHKYVLGLTTCQRCRGD